MQNNKLTSFNEGGSHESNPYSGIPIGGNNRVEQGETKNKNFIYSDRLYANEDLAKQFNLPSYIKGKTFANASKVIDQKFNGRSDIHSNATKKELLDRLSEAQEHLKQQEEQVNQSMQVNLQQGPEDMMNGQIPEGMEEYTNQQPQQEEQVRPQQFAFGGDMYIEDIDPRDKFNNKNSPTKQDSLDVYNNSVKLDKYFNNKNNYHHNWDKKLTEKELSEIQKEGLSSFRNNNRKAIVPISGNNDAKKIQIDESNYYKDLGNGKYKQRESKNAILDTRSPMPLYHKGIIPQYLSSYENNNGFDSMYGDNIELPRYDSLAIKPYDMLTASEKKQRIQKYGTKGFPSNYNKINESPRIKSEPVSNLEPQGLKTVDENQNYKITNITPKARIPKGYNYTEEINQNFGGHKTNGYAKDYDQIPTNDLGPGNSRTITPIYKYGGNLNKFEGGGNVSTNNPYTIKTGQYRPLTQVVTNDAKLEKEIGEKNYSNNKLQPYVSGYNAIAPKISNSIYTEGNDEKRSSEIQSVNTVGNSVGSIVGGKTGGMIGNGITAATGLYEIGSEAFGNSNVDTSGQHSISGASSGRSAGSGALKGAGTGAAIGSYVGPWGTVIGAGVGAIVGGVSGFIGGKKDEDAQSENNARYAKNVNDKFSDHYAYGGNLKQYRNEGTTDEEDSVNPLFKPTNTIPQVGASTIKAYPSNASIGDYVNRPNNFYTINGYQSRKNINPVNGNFGPKTSAQFRLDNQDRSPENIDLSELRKTEPDFVMPTGIKDGMEKYYKDQKETVSNESKNVDKKENHVVKYLDKNGGKFLKYAPVAMNAYQLSQLKKPENKQLERLTDRYNPKYVDEAQLQNIVRQEGNNQSSAIQQMGGSEGSLRNALLATGLNKTKSLSDSYMKANEFNRAEDEKAQEFNSRISEFNARTQHQESDNHERNDAAYRNEKSKYLSSIGTDLGEIGKEEVNKNQIAAALGYTVNGDYVVNKKTGEKTLATDFYKMIESGKAKEPEKKAYSGFINMNKIGRK